MSQLRWAYAGDGVLRGPLGGTPEEKKAGAGIVSNLEEALAFQLRAAKIGGWKRGGGGAPLAPFKLAGDRGGIALSEATRELERRIAFREAMEELLNWRELNRRITECPRIAEALGLEVARAELLQAKLRVVAAEAQVDLARRGW